MTRKRTDTNLMNLVRLITKDSSTSTRHIDLAVWRRNRLLSYTGVSGTCYTRTRSPLPTKPPYSPFLAQSPTFVTAKFGLPEFSYHDEILANFEEGVGWILRELEADRQTLSVNVRGTTLSPRSTLANRRSANGLQSGWPPHVQHEVTALSNGPRKVTKRFAFQFRNINLSLLKVDWFPYQIHHPELEKRPPFPCLTAFKASFSPIAFGTDEPILSQECLKR